MSSILGQTFQDFELILVDDGSPDRALSLCREWAKKDQRIRVVHKENGGLSSARNAGLEVAEGSYIGFVDADDWISPDMYEVLYHVAERHNAGYSAIDMVITRSGRPSLGKAEYQEAAYSQEQLFRIFFRADGGEIKYCVCDKLYKADLIGETRFWEGMRFEDIDFNFHILQKCKKAVYVNQIKYYYYYNTEGITRNQLVLEDLQLLRVWGRIERACSRNYPEYLHFAHMNHLRAYMGLLGKGAKFGVSKDFSGWGQQKSHMLRKLRAGFPQLLKWRMPISRKLLLAALCIHPDLVAALFYVRRRLP